MNARLFLKLWELLIRFTPVGKMGFVTEIAGHWIFLEITSSPSPQISQCQMPYPLLFWKKKTQKIQAHNELLDNYLMEVVYIL